MNAEVITPPPSYTPLAEWMKPFNPSNSYGFFGYKGYAIESAMMRDDVAAIKEAHARGWIAPDSITLDNTPLRAHCAKKGAAKVADALGAMGYPA